MASKRKDVIEPELIEFALQNGAHLHRVSFA